jgi:hypothetical protein
VDKEMQEVHQRILSARMRVVAVVVLVVLALTATLLTDTVEMAVLV